MVPPARALLGGGIGSGKSTAAAIFASLGAAVFSADTAAHAVLEPGGAAFAAVAERWPQCVVGGRIDRGALAEIVFGDAAARAALEEITHPAIARLLAEWVSAVPASPAALVEMPLPIDLLGPGWCWVVVDAPDEVRRSRLVGRWMTPAETARRMAAQPSREEWLEKADLVVDNGAGPDRLELECRRAWQVLLAWGPGDGGGAAP